MPVETVPSAGPARVVARGWGWRHAGRRAWAVSDLDLTIEPGERVLVLGASGAGKTTFVHALAGVLGGEDEGEEAGTLTVDGADAKRVRGRVGLVLQDPDSQVVLARVGDDVAFGPENLGVPRDEIWRRVGASLDAVGLDLPLDHPTSSLSGGQKQRLALAGVLAMRPGLLLLDEPTANLDPDGVTEVRNAVAHALVNRSSTLVIVEHRVDTWWHFVDRVIVLRPGGGILADGLPAEILEREGRALSASGVWVPGHEPVPPFRNSPTFRNPSAPRNSPTSRNGTVLGTMLSTNALAIGRPKSPVLQRGFDLTLDAGSCLAITGANGAGKSTLGLTLGGLLAPAGGTLDATGLTGGSRLSPDPIRWKSRELVTRIGTVFQDPEHQFVASTVRAELEVGAVASGLDAAETARRVDALLERLRLTALAEANPFTLSGGEKRRLSVATVLVTRPPLLVLDEPTFAQDARTWRELVALLSSLLDEGSSVVAITHDERLVAALADDELRMTASAHELSAGVGR